MKYGIRGCDNPVLEGTAAGLCEEMLNPSTEMMQEELAPLQIGTSGRILHSPTAPTPWDFGLSNASSGLDLDSFFFFFIPQL